MEFSATVTFPDGTSKPWSQVTDAEWEILRSPQAKMPVTDLMEAMGLIVELKYIQDEGSEAR